MFNFLEFIAFSKNFLVLLNHDKAATCTFTLTLQAKYSIWQFTVFPVVLLLIILLYYTYEFVFSSNFKWIVWYSGK